MKLPWQKPAPDLFSKEEQEQLMQAIRAAERNTSGEIRLFIEPKCRFVDPVDRARELFFQLRMNETKERNATLVYLAHADHQYAVFGDEGIYQKLGQKYWEDEVRKMKVHFRADHLADGLCQAITDIGEALKTYFPHQGESDRNELPDEIVFGT